MPPSFDILGLGCVAVDDLLYIASYPPPDAKVAIRRHERQCGGLAATAMVAAARLGAKCAYAGTLGDDELSRFVFERLSEDGVDSSLIRLRPGAKPIHSYIVVDESEQTRTIFYDLNGVCSAEPGWPGAEFIRSSRVLFVDHYGIEGMIWASTIARQAGVPIVADFENDALPQFPELLALVDHVIVSFDFARKLTGETDPATAARKLWRDDRQAVVVTYGAEGCWYLDASCVPCPCHQPAYRVQVVDTTGCGDVFHGAYAAALVRGQGLAERIRFASGAAALKATRYGGQAGIPSRAAVEEFLAGH